MNDITSIEDPAAAEAFAEGVSTIVNHGAIAVMMSIGHRLGLFQTLERATYLYMTALATGALVILWQPIPVTV